MRNTSIAARQTHPTVREPFRHQQTCITYPAVLPGRHRDVRQRALRAVRVGCDRLLSGFCAPCYVAIMKEPQPGEARVAIFDFGSTWMALNVGPLRVLVPARMEAIDFAQSSMWGEANFGSSSIARR